MANAATPVTTPRPVCQRWRRTMSAKGIEPSSRRCGFQPVSRPARIWNTEPDWISIAIGAISAESRISIRKDRVSRPAPPLARRVPPSRSARINPKNFGASRMPMVSAKSWSARTGSKRGQTG
ncbi:hypothetical protein CHKEEEPN_4683 [Methylorubrum podarium]|nr:hypothetical protein CHKEEEPN_4683 [Methylorubrum podarium]